VVVQKSNLFHLGLILDSHAVHRFAAHQKSLSIASEVKLKKTSTKDTKSTKKRSAGDAPASKTGLGT
jgi:hypothetical protein